MRYFEDFPVGAEYELGSRSLSQDEIVAFARDYDPQPFHTDPVAAKSSAFGTLVASGWQTMGVFMSLLVKSLLADTASMGSPGVEGIQWLKPVKPGDQLTGHLRVLEAMPSKSRADRGVVKTEGRLTNQDGEVVMTVRAINFFGRRPATA
ncbi:MAG TPA: MaoC family dehydratase [Stellaceae bacterium]